MRVSDDAKDTSLQLQSLIYTEKSFTTLAPQLAELISHLTSYSIFLSHFLGESLSLPLSITFSVCDASNLNQKVCNKVKTFTESFLSISDDLPK
jgi:hypothetical protein